MSGPINEVTPLDEYATTNAQAIAEELAIYGSPLVPYADYIYQCGMKYHIDPSFFLGVVWGENNYGTVKSGTHAWDPETRTGTYNWASISRGYYGGVQDGTRWGYYPSPERGIEAFFRLISEEYYPRGQNTIYKIWWGVGGSPYTDGDHAYAPASENAAHSANWVIERMNKVYREKIPFRDGNPSILADIESGSVLWKALVGVPLVALAWHWYTEAEKM